MIRANSVNGDQVETKVVGNLIDIVSEYISLSRTVLVNLYKETGSTSPMLRTLVDVAEEVGDKNVKRELEMLLNFEVPEDDDLD